MVKNPTISPVDKGHYRILRLSISQFLKKCGSTYDKQGKLLDIAPSENSKASKYFNKAKVYTLNIDGKTNPDYLLDICKNNHKHIPNNYFDLVVCAEVLEHVLNPFSAIKEIHRILKKGGILMLTTPFNFRIHGPLPDCWRFTEHGLRELLKKFHIIEISETEDRKRWLMPISYRVIAKKN